MLLKSCTSCGPCELPSARSPFAGFTEDAEKAMAVSPGYFEAWDRWKTLALLGAVAVTAYQFGRRAR